MKRTLYGKGWEEANSTDSVSHFTFAAKEPKQIRAILGNAVGPGWEAVLEGENSVSNICFTLTGPDHAFSAHWYNLPTECTLSSVCTECVCSQSTS